MINKVRRSTGYKTPKPDYVPDRPIYGVVLHHTGGSTPVSCHAAGSWHYMIDRDDVGTVYADVDEQDVAWHCASTDRWRPEWVPSSGLSWFTGSIINSYTIGIELVSCPGTAASGYSAGQLASTRVLLDELCDRHGSLWIVGHGHVQKDRRTTEPDDFPWASMGMTWVDGYGYRYSRSNGESSVPSTNGEDEMTEDQKQLLAETLRHDLVHAGDIDQLVGRYDLLAQQVASLEDLLKTAQEERDAATARAEAAEEKCKDCDPAVVGGA